MQKSTYFLTINNLFKIWKANSLFDSNGHHRQNKETVFSISYWKKRYKKYKLYFKTKKDDFLSNKSHRHFHVIEKAPPTQDRFKYEKSKLTFLEPYLFRTIFIQLHSKNLIILQLGKALETFGLEGLDLQPSLEQWRER